MKLKQSLSVAILLSCTFGVNAQKSPVDYVDPFIGTTNFSVCNPGALRPHSMMSVVPFNVMGSDLNVYDKDSRWWSTPYLYENRYFTGFAHVTLSGVGCPELGTLLLMPTSGKLDVDYHNYGSEYKHEKAVPGYYSNELTKYGIRCEVTATMRSSIERFTFRKGEAHLLMNIGNGLTNEVGGYIKRVSPTEIEGTRLVGTFCYNSQAVFPMYFVMRVNKVPKEAGFWKKQPKLAGVAAEWDHDNGKYKLYKNYGRELAGNEIGYYFSYDAEEGEQLEVQIGVSFVSTANARENLEKEQQGFDFEKVCKDARREWEKTLGVVTVEGGSEAQKKIFYTALYHTQIHPNVLQDVNGEYPKMESAENGVTSGNRYTVYSLWDTYRNVHQLETLLYPERQLDMVRSMIDMYREWGWMPKWELYGRETWTMEGDPSIPVITDTYLKGLRDFDIHTAYEAFRKSATLPGKDNLMRPDIDDYIRKGYVPMGVYAQDNSGDNSVSHALEYYIADHALANLAMALGHKDDAKLFRKRSLGYKNYYSKADGTLRPKKADGSWFSPFNPEDGADFSNAPGFHEGSAWNYTFYVPHDVQGLAKLMGGSKAFVNKLQMVFDKGLYDPANEPDIAYPYLFNYFKGEEWRTQEETYRQLMKNFTDKPDGIPGNDDCGTMSAWALFTMMGIYPDCPGSPYYSLTAPVFDKITLHLDKRYYPEGDVVIEAVHPQKDSHLIRSMQLGEKTLARYRISHDEFVKGRILKFNLK